MELLVADDSEDDFALIVRQLRVNNYTVHATRISSQAELDAALEKHWDLLICDWMMPGFSGAAVLETLRARDSDLPCIVVSGTPGEEVAVQSLHLGALDFLSKDRPARLVPAVQRALREAENRRARVAIERELRLSEERYRTGFALAPEALLSYDLVAGRIVDGNAAAERLFERSLDELRAAPFASWGMTHSESVFERVKAGESVHYPWLLRIGDEIVPTEAHAVLLPTRGRTIARIQLTDLRERIRAEAMRRHSADLEMRNRQIQEANRLKSEFLANMSHELRTPLNAIIGFSELLYDGQVEPESPQYGEFLGDILTSGRHLLRLVNDVLDLAKVEAGKLEFRPVTFEIGTALAEVVAILRTAASSKQIRIEIETSGVGEVTLDPSRFKQVAYNFLSNALKFTPLAGRVMARVLADGPERLRFEVEDTGIGIASADVGRLFNEFQQLGQHQGTGLGLALTRRIVEAQGGSVGVRSEVGKGSTFHAILPRRTGAMAAPLVPRTMTREGAQTVLVVEDDERDQAQLVATLANAGYSVELAATGADALALWRTRPFDALTIDLLLPDMSGLDLLAALSSEPRPPAIPVIVITVIADKHVVAGHAVHDVLTKPVDRDALLASLRRAGVRARS